MIRTALVIGGGIAGPVAAMALQKAGIDAAVYEAYPSRADDAGGGLTLAPNGLDALDVIGIGGLVRPAGMPVTGIVMQDWKGKRLGEFGNPPGVPPMQFFYRSDLYRVLHEETRRRGIRTEHGKRLVGATQTEEGVTARFDDGSTVTADILIGADGIHSTVRGLIDADAPGPSYTGLISFGGRVANPGVPSTAGKMAMSFGKHAFFGYQVFDETSAIWFVNLPYSEPLSVAQARRPPASKWLPLLAATFAEDRTPAAQLISRTDPADLLIVGPMENMPRVPVWSRGRMVLVGDAAHAPSSSSGQGASLAIESAIVLARCLRDLPCDQALAAYETLRRPRVERVIKETSRKNSSKTAGPVGRVFFALAMKIFTKLAKPEKVAWMFDYRIDWDAPVAAVAPATSALQTA
jgi:2-polyprenyl-6-methoxyphenol hydroxylase-like FAD-dependent oxidoreductase